MLSAGGVIASPCKIPKFTGERAKQLTPTETGGSVVTHFLFSNDRNYILIFDLDSHISFHLHSWTISDFSGCFGDSATT